MRQIETESASDRQIRDFCGLLGIEGLDKLDRDGMLEAMAIAGQPTDKIFAEDEDDHRLDLKPQPVRPDSGFDPENERWCVVRIHADQRANTNKLSSLFLSHGNAETGSFIYAKRGTDIVIRERFFDVLSQAVRIETDQMTQDDGNVIGHFKDATRQTVKAHPHDFHGYVGFVKDGPPDPTLVSGMEVYSN